MKDQALPEEVKHTLNFPAAAVNQNNDGGFSTDRLADSTWYVVWHFGQNRWNS